MSNRIIDFASPTCDSAFAAEKGVDGSACAHREGHQIDDKFDETAAESTVAKLTEALFTLESELDFVQLSDLNRWHPGTISELIFMIATLLSFFIVIYSRNILGWLGFLACSCSFLYLKITRDRDAWKIKKQAIDALEKEINQTKDALTKNQKCT